MKEQPREVPLSGPRPERHVVVGHRVEGGGDCTVLLIREGDGWVLYPHGAASMAVALSKADADALAHGILGTAP